MFQIASRDGRLAALESVNEAVAGNFGDAFSRACIEHHSGHVANIAVREMRQDLELLFTLREF